MMLVKTGLLLLLLAVTAAAATTARKNVVYFLFDDLRPNLSPYFNTTTMHTPHLQRLADTGAVFERAYCNQAVCAPSRLSWGLPCVRPPPHPLLRRLKQPSVRHQPNAHRGE